MLGSNRTIGFIPSKDLKRTRDFYENTLGLRFVRDDGFAVIFNSGDRMIRAANICQLPDFKPYPFTILGWEVTDVHATAAALHERGIRFERFPGMNQDDLGVWASPTGDSVAWFKDPDGNVLSVSTASR